MSLPDFKWTRYAGALRGARFAAFQTALTKYNNTRLQPMLPDEVPERLRRTMNRRLRRNETARLYHWRSRNRLPPRRFDQRS